MQNMDLGVFSVSVLTSFVLTLTGLETFTGLLALAILCFIDWLFAMIVISKTDKILTTNRFADKGIDFIIYFLCIVAVNQLGKIVFPESLDILATYTSGVLTAYFALGEFVSLAEHAGELGVQLPTKLLDGVKKHRNNI
jgi:phage-related holin